MPRLHLRSIVLAAVFLCLHTPHRAAQAGDSDLLAEFEISNSGDLIILPGTINGRQARFWLDTACSRTILDNRYQGILGNPERTEYFSTADGKVQVGLHTAPEISVGRLRRDAGELVGCMDLDLISEWAGTELDGILGIEFLQYYSVQIDFDKGWLRFLRASAPRNGKRYDSATAFGEPLEIELNLEGLGAVPFLIDTGFNGSIALSKKGFEVLQQDGRLNSLIQLHQATPTGKRLGTTGFIRHARIGTHVHERLLVTEADEEMIGLSYLARFVVTLDFPHRAVYLAKGDSFQRLDRRDCSGVNCLLRNGTIVVDSVKTDSPAAIGGLRPGDIVRSVDGERALSLFELRRRLERNGELVVLEIERDGLRSTTELSLPVN